MQFSPAGVQLPEAARVGGATTIAQLSEVLLAARYDVSALTTLELLRWDYKEGERAGGGGTVGIAAICETYEELLARSGGGPSSLEVAMAEAAERRGGLSVLLALTKEDEAEGGLKGLVALLPPGDELLDPPLRGSSGEVVGKAAEVAAEATAAAASVRKAEALLDAVAGIPILPAALASNGLFKAQSIEEEGFGINWQKVDGAPRLRVSKLRGVATRKTLMPAVLRLGLDLRPDQKC